jgi:hypothetical protein
MTTEVIFVELKLYETNLAKLLTTYEEAHKNYVDSLQQQNPAGSTQYLKQLDDLNGEILLLMAEISQSIVKINNDEKYAKYKADIVKKMSDLNTLNDKMQTDEATIKSLMSEMFDLDGKNESLRLKQKSNLYYIAFSLIFIIVIIYSLITIFASNESNSLENIILVLAILFLVYLFWYMFYGWGRKATEKTSVALSNFLNKY